MTAGVVRYVEAPQECELPHANPSIFLAGGVQGCRRHRARGAASN